jgi:OmpA-OmpF porin, OOP family
MASSMMDSILGMVTPEIKQSLASRLGESPQAVQSGLGTATAATLGSLANRAGDSGFLGQVTGLLGGGGGQNILGSLPSIASSGPTGAAGDVVNKFLGLVFGSQQGQVASAVAQQAGLSAASGTGVLKMAAPLVLGYLAKMQSAGSLSTNSLGNMLRSEAPTVQGYLPTGLVSSGVTNFGTTTTRTVSQVENLGTTVTGGASRWLIPLAILGALLLAWLVFRSTTAPRHVVETATNAATTTANTAANVVHNAATTTQNAAQAAWARLGNPMQLRLPDGTELNAPEHGVEGRLVSYMNDASAPVSEDRWFDFDRLLFDSNSATLQPASQDQLNNVAAIMKAYPQMKITIGGYTDNTGDPAANQTLSQQRADSVMAALTALGVDPSRMQAHGFGSDHPIGDNSTEEGRQQNRRISLRVTDKGAPAS